MTSERRERIIFTSEQQKRVDELIDLSYSKGRRKAAQEAKAEIDRLKAEIAELKANKNKFAFWRR